MINFIYAGCCVIKVSELNAFTSVSLSSGYASVFQSSVLIVLKFIRCTKYLYSNKIFFWFKRLKIKFKIKDKILLSPEILKMERPGLGKLRVVHKDHAGKFNRSMMVTIFLSNLYVFWVAAMDGVYLFYQQWPFLVYGLTLVAINIYIWWPGYVEFDNDKEQVIIKRYQHKLRPSKIIPYSQIKSIELNFNQKMTEYGDSYQKYFFKLKLFDGAIQPMFSLVDKRKAKKIKTWIDQHVSFDYEMKRRNLKPRKPIFRFDKK